MVNRVQINKNEVLRYLGYKNQELDSITNKLIDDSISEITNIIEKKSTYKIFDIRKSKGKIWIKDTNLSLVGNDIKEHLKHSESIILMAVTLGNEIDRIIRYYEKMSMTKAMILDACASAAIEEICDRVNDELKTLVSQKGKTLTSRFSPGYGDLAIDIQNSLLDLLEVKKTIGLTVTSHNILIPRKSVTAILGIIDEKDKKEEEVGCGNCLKNKECNFRKGDVECGN